VFGVDDRQCWFDEVAITYVRPRQRFSMGTLAHDFGGSIESMRGSTNPFVEESFEIPLSRNQEVGAIHELPLTSWFRADTKVLSVQSEIRNGQTSSLRGLFSP
jgi:hypothetical protein